MANYIGAKDQQAAADEILVAFAAEAKKDQPESSEAQVLVIRWRDHIAAYHNSCDEEKLRRLGHLYGADDRFAEMLDSYGDGTAHFMGDAILAYLEQQA